MEKILTHKHLIVSCKVTNPPKCVNYIKTWISKLIKDIDMEILIGPHAIYYEMPGNNGLTVFTVITTSHISLHTFDDVDPAIFELDVYSCKDFDIDTIFAAVQEFDPVDIRYKFLDRENDLTILKEN